MSPPRPYYGQPKDCGESESSLSKMNSQMLEVKHLFMTRRFKNCAGRCEEALRHAGATNVTTTNCLLLDFVLTST